MNDEFCEGKAGAGAGTGAGAGVSGEHAPGVPSLLPRMSSM